MVLYHMKPYDVVTALKHHQRSPQRVDPPRVFKRMAMMSVLDAGPLPPKMGAVTEITPFIMCIILKK
jgi:hypothetical protein